MQTGEKRLEELAEKLQHERDMMWTRQAAVKEQEDQLAGKTTLEKEESDLQKGVAQGEARLAEIGRAEAEWERTGVTELAETEARLASDTILPEAQATLAELTQELAQVGYDQNAHAEATAARDQLAEAPKRYQAWERSVAAVTLIDGTQAALAT